MRDIMGRRCEPKMIKTLIIFDSGSYGRTVADLAEQLGCSPITVLDDTDPEHSLSSFVDYINPFTEFIPAFGNNEFRLSWCNRISNAGGQLATLIHPTAYVSPKANVTPGTVVLPHAIISTDVVVKRGCIINLSAIIDHGCIIEEGCHICLGAIVKGENRVPRLAKIEAGEVVERAVMQ